MKERRNRQYEKYLKSSNIIFQWDIFNRLCNQYYFNDTWQSYGQHVFNAHFCFDICCNLQFYIKNNHETMKLKTLEEN